MLTRQIAPMTALLALILTLTATLALACGPAAPPSQSPPPPVAAEPTATATLTPTDTPEPAVTPQLEFIAQAVYRLAEQQQSQGASGASGSSAGPQLPERIYIHVTAWTGAVDDLEEMLRDNGATDINVMKDVNTSGVEAQIPPTLLPDITRHTAFLHAFTGGIYPNMEHSLSEALTMYAGGVFDASKTARKIMRNQYFPEYPENIIVKIELDSPDRYASVRDFLAANDAFPHSIKPGTSWFYAGVPVAIMDQLYWHEGVRYIDHYPRYYTHDVLPASSRPVSEDDQTALNRRQGARVHGALTWNSNGNTAGNVKIGIIDNGFMGFAGQMGQDLPAPTPARVHYSCYNPMTQMSTTGRGTPDMDTCSTNTTHGTMVAEAVYDVAPGAILYISNDHTNEAADWMVRNGVKIINHSRGSHWDGPGDGTSTIATSSLKTVEKAASNGVLWVNAAGNHALTSWFNSSVRTNQTPAGNFVRFDATDDCNTVALKARKQYDFQIRWDGVWGGNNEDLSVQIWRETTTAIPDGTSSTSLYMYATSGPVQPSGTSAKSDPYDDLSYEPSVEGDYCLRIQVPGNNTPGWVQVQNTTGPSLEYNGDGQSIAPPGDSREAGMLTVGAAHWSTPSVIQPNSGVGPTRDGRIKPDIVGADGAYAAVDGKPVTGTSQAAPHVAGLAALLLQRHPRYTPELLAYFLKSNALQRVTGTVPNNTWGHGFAWLPSPTATPALPTGARGTGGHQKVTLSWNEAANATGYVVEQWDGRAVPPAFRELPFRETGRGYNRLYEFTLTGAGAEISNLVNGVRYTHRIRSTNGSRKSRWATWVHTGAITPVAVPHRLSGTGRHGGVDLDWHDARGATAYEVQQWDPGRGWRTLPFRNSSYTIEFNVSSAQIRGLSDGVRYYHRVRATNGTYNSRWTGWIRTETLSATGSAGGQDTQMPPPPADSGLTGSTSGQGAPTPTPTMPQNQPSGLTARLTDGAVVLHWVPGNNPNYVKQVVKRREAGIRPELWTDFEVDVSAQTYTDRSAQSGKTYIYRIKGLRDNGRGGTSNRATVTTR